MNRLQEIASRKNEIRSIVEKSEDVEEIQNLNDEVDALNKEEELIKEHQEEGKDAKALEHNESKAQKIDKEEKKMNEKRFTISSPEYRSAWAKKTMGLSDDKFTADELRALGDAITTTATEFVASDADTQGINNGGLLIPTSLREDFLELVEKDSPIFRDIRKLAISGNIELPYLFAADDASWYSETTETVNEGQEYKNLQLTGWELAKDVVITWKLEEMSVESFIKFIIDELYDKVGKTLINAVIYGTGQNQPTGITIGLTPVTDGDNAIERVLAAYRSLSQENRIGAKVYISTEVNLDIVSYKDLNGNYPYLSGLPAVNGFSIEVDPYLKNDDIIAGNCRYYILNENTPVRVDKEKHVKGRKVIYGAYAIYDGKAKPGAFVYGKKPVSA